ncbi:MAG: SDR family oxidoreductase [Gammaproteobacteria bacterium]|nr:SDR family oxidoreductase [Gammaproteobacteria bacterium]
MKNILILGATSTIAQHTARIYAEQNCHLFLLARDTAKLQMVADDLLVRGAAAVEFFSLDINDLERHESAIDAARAFSDTIDLLLVAHGTLPDQQRCEEDPQYLWQEFQTNAGSTISFLSRIAGIFEAQKSGTIAVVTSVAGDRGRRSNYVYGAAKAAVSTYLSGLRNRLDGHGVQVLDIRPGFVDTAMTAEFDKGLLWAQPQTVATGIVKAVARKKDVVYLPFFWRFIMLVIRLIPERVFKRLSL